MFYARYISTLILFLIVAQPLLAQEVVLLHEDFDAVSNTELPSGWVEVSGEWETSIASSSNGSGMNNLMIDGGELAQIDFPVLNFSHAASASLSYAARRTSTFLDTSFWVKASLDGGATFPFVIVDTSLAAPEEKSTYEVVDVELPDTLLGQSDVIFRFEVLANDSSSGNLRIDDVEVSATWEGGSTFGFASAASSTLGNSGNISVPLQLFYTDSTDLQGIEWTLTWDDSRVEIDSLSLGPQVGAGWELHVELGQGSGNILLYNQTNSIPSGNYPELVTLHVSTLPLVVDSTTAVLSISSIIGAHATPEATSAVIVALEREHSMYIERRYARPEVTSYVLDLGATSAGDTSKRNVIITNTGTVPLVVERSVGETSPFALSSDSFSVLPETNVAIEIAHTPTMVEFGYLTDTLHFAHNGDATDTISVIVSALGVGGRGDASQDGLTDVSDLVSVVDYVIEREAPNEAQRQSIDLHPFPAGNGNVDVRDLVVLAQAIVHDEWPDDVALPAAPPAPDVQQSFVAHNRISSDVRVSVTKNDVSLDTDISLRALQLEFDVSSSSIHPNVVAPPGWTISAYVDEDERVLRVLAYSLSGESLAPGEYVLFKVGDTVTPRWGVAVDDDEQRQPVVFTSSSTVGTTSSNNLPEHFEVGLPYPNPLTGDKLTIPVSLPQPAAVEAAVFDVLGRRVVTLEEGARAAGIHTFTWQSRTATAARVAPGIYLLRIIAGENSATRKIVVR